MSKRLFVLDTNVLMHDPTALFRFKEHDIFLPMVVLEELDAAKKGLSEVARNVRQVSRFMDQLMQGRSHDEIAHGLVIDASRRIDIDGTEAPSGRLFFQVQPASGDLPNHLPGNKADNSILHTALSLQQDGFAGHELTLVSKDINLRIKAAVLGIHAEDYENDKVLEDTDLLTPGFGALAPDFWERQGGASMESWQESGRSFYRLHTDEAARWHLNEFLHFPNGEGPDLVVRQQDERGTVLEVVRDFASGRQPVWGVSARNREQNFALNLLMDPEIDFVTLLGPAGTGKTLLTLAAGLAQTLDEQRYREIIMTRNTVPLGDDIGFLPGTEEEKMTPWMGALMDNLEVLTHSGDGEWERAATQELLSKRIKVRTMNFMRGRTFVNRYLIVDEAQNLTAKQMKTLITRAGPGTKIVCLGNLAQIDTPYLTETTSGLTFVVDRFRGWAHGGHVTLARGERSRLADFASQAL